jgi:hypothetical protein
MFFFEKKNQKTFDYGLRLRRLRDSQSRVFCFFSSFLEPDREAPPKRAWRQDLGICQSTNEWLLYAAGVDCTVFEIVHIGPE